MKSSSLSSFSRRQSAGFTIIELLVSVGITALLVTLMLTIVTNVLNGWNRSSGSLVSGNQARVVLDQLSQDLQSAVMRRDTNVWFAATVIPDSFTGAGSDWSGSLVKPTGASSSTSSLYLTGMDASGAHDTVTSTYTPDLTTYRFGQSGMWLRFFTTPPDTNSSTDITTTSAPRAVAYQIIRKTVGASKVYQFFRAEARPAATTGSNSTFNAGYNLFMTPVSGIGYNTKDAAPVSGATDTAVGNVGNICYPRPSQLIANNVVDFGVRIWGRDSSNNLVLVFPTTATGKYAFAATTSSTAVSPESGAYTPTQTIYGFPEVVEVFVRILTDEGARQIAALEAGNITGDWWQIANANSQVYTRRIEIKSRVP
jgi:type II secretory pathway pseudopilin PulG